MGEIDDWDVDEPEPCDHEDYDADILTGIATCGCCGFRWMQTAEQRESARLHAIAYEAQCDIWNAEQALDEVRNEGAVPIDDLKDDLPF